MNHESKWLSHEHGPRASLQNTSFDEHQTSSSSPHLSATTNPHWNHDDKPLPRPPSAGPSEKRKSSVKFESAKERAESAGKKRFTVTNLNTKSNLAGSVKAVNTK